MTPSSTPPSPPLPGGKASPGGISARKVILGIILAGSVLFFVLILFAGGVAILREGAQRGYGGKGAGLLPASVEQVIRHVIRRHFSVPHHK